MIVTNITNIGDPQILLYNDKYYCYATSLGLNGGFAVWESDDLVNWSEPTVCLEKSGHWGDNSFWAPEVIYHNGKFVMHYTARIEAKNKTYFLGVAVADNPKGPFVDVYGAPMFDLGYSTIDGSVLVCDKGNFLYYSRDCSQNIINNVLTSQIYCVKLDETLTKCIGEHTLMTTPEYEWELKSLPGRRIWNEGPNVIKYGEKYIMNYSANFYASNDYSICIAVADNPMGPWKKESAANPVLCSREGLFGAGHNAFFTSKDGKLMTAFHVQTNPENPSGNRKVCIGEVVFKEENGVIYEDIL